MSNLPVRNAVASSPNAPRGVVRDAEPVDAPLGAFDLQPLEVLAPREEVVHLLDLDAAEPCDLLRVLLATLGDGARPDLRRNGATRTAPVERRSERAFSAAIHRRGVEDAHAGLEYGTDDVVRSCSIGAEGVPRSEADDRPEPTFFHRAQRQRAG